jgi:hypothetical protein
MGRAQKQKRRPTPSVERKPTATGEGKGAGVTKRTGTERPQSATAFPTDIADPQARVIKTRS